LDKLWEFVEKTLGFSSCLEDAVHPFIKSSFQLSAVKAIKNKINAIILANHSKHNKPIISSSQILETKTKRK